MGHSQKFLKQKKKVIKKYIKWEDCLELRECKSLQKLNKLSPISPGINNIIK